MHTDDKRQGYDRHDADHERAPREGVLARVRAVAHGLGERVRKALERDDDTQPPGFNGMMLVA